ALSNPAQPRERKEYAIPPNAVPLVAVTKDKEATNNVVLIFYKHPPTRLKTIADFRYQLMAELFTSMLNNRLREISQKPGSPYIYGSSSYGKFLARSNDAYMLTALAKENKIDSSLLTILEENERVKKFGFTATEFERQKEEMLSKYDKASKEYDKTESEKFTGEYVDHYLSGDAYPSARKQLLFVIHLLPDIKLEEINALAGKWVTDTNMAMVVMAPDKENVKVPTQEQLLAVVNQSKTISMKPYIDNFREEPLINKELQPGTIVSRKENKALGFTEIQLSNGVTVVVKPTLFKNDEILVSAYSLGGHSMYSDKDFMSANYASQVIGMSGAGNFDNIELEKKLKGKNLEVNPYIEDVRQGIRGNSTPKDFETLLQLIYLYYDGPRRDSTAFEAFISQMSNQMKFMKSSPVMTFYDTLFKSVYPGYKRLVVFPTEAQLQEVKLDDIYRIYKDRFADASGVKFFIAGNINVDTIAPLLIKYLGSLPSLKRNEQWKDVSPQFPKGITNVTFNKGSDPQGMVGLVLSKKMEWNQQNLLALSMLKEILSIKLIEVIREKLSGVYSPQVMLNPDHYPQSQFQLIIMFGCSPATTDKLTKAVLGEIKKIRKKGPTAVDLQKAQESLIRERETNLEKNEFWQAKIESVYYDNTDPASILNFKERVNAMTTADLQKIYESMIDPGNYVRVVLKPEKK
ncbi:MAG: insulinase family protein, partial [Bacteroidota bacterium]